MPVWLEILLGVLLGLILLLTLGGMVANTRRRRLGRARLETEMEHANLALAAAHAQDRGWERSVLESTARSAYDAINPATPATELTLVQVIDHPGVDEDKAVFRVVSAVGESRLTLGRSGGEWRAE